MKKTKVGLIIILFGLIFGGIQSIALEVRANNGNMIYSITQITDNEYDDVDPDIHNGLVTWCAYDGNDHEIYLYDYASQTTIQITDNTLTDVSPQIHDGQVVWQGSDGSDYEIFLYDYNSHVTTQITDNTNKDEKPVIHNGLVAWWHNDGNDNEVYIYDHSTSITTQITDNEYLDNWPQIHDGLVTWCGGVDTWDIFLYDHSTQITTQITDNTFRDYWPTVHNGLVTWFGYHGGLAEIFLYDYSTGTTSQITNDYHTDYYPQIHNGQITWGKHDGDIDIYFYDLASDTTVRITDDTYRAWWPMIDNGQVTWQQIDDGEWDIFLYDFSSDTIIQINDDSLDDNRPQIHNGMVTWWGYDGSDYEIFIATPSNTPPLADAGLPQDVSEAETVIFDASGSSDPDGDPLEYRWDFDGDGTWDTGWDSSPFSEYTWFDDYTGQVIVEVSDGTVEVTAETTVTVNNVAPMVSIDDVIQPFPDFILPSDVIEFYGSFFDPGIDDTHIISWDFGDDTIVYNTLTSTHAYSEAGIYTITLYVEDDDGGMGSASVIITVESPEEAAEEIIGDVEVLDLPGESEQSLVLKLRVAQSAIENDRTDVAIRQLNAFIWQVEAMGGKKLTDEEADALISAAQWLIDHLVNNGS